MYNKSKDLIYMKIIIVEDELIWQEKLREYLLKFSLESKIDYKISIYNDGDSFLKDYKNDADLIFMDIELGKNKINGMEISKKLREFDNNVLLIFVTNMSQFAVEGYEVDAIDFIVKPLNYYSFKMKIEKACRIIGKEASSKNKMLSVENGTKNIMSSEVLYIEVRNHNLFYHTKSEEYKVRSTMKEASKLLEGLPFSKCNNCYLVNLSYVKEIAKEDVILNNGIALKMPRTRRKEFIEDLGNYLSGANK